MNLMDDPLNVVSDLRPAGLDRLAEGTYARRRAGDLARMLGEPAPGGLLTASGLLTVSGLPAPDGRVAPAGGLRSRVLASRAIGPRVLVVAGAALTAAAVAAAVLIASPVHGHPAQGPAQSSGAPVGTVPAGGANSTQAVLLTAAHVAAAQPAGAGAYWYVKERDFEPTTPGYAGKGRPAKGVKVAREYGASFAATEESWTGASRTRTIVDENLVFGFASAAGKKRWEAAGSPKLAGQAGIGRTGPVASDYPFGGYSYNIGAIKVSLAKAGKLPTTPGKLELLLHRAWKGLTPQQRAATVGVANPSYAQYLFQVAGALLTGPVTPGTRSAVYGLLAKESGLTVATNVTDPLGRTGTAIGDGTGDFLIISPATAQVLDLTTYPVRTGSTISGKLDGTEAYLSMGWTDRLGTPAAS